MNKEIKLAYIAGVLDGDGSFSLIKNPSSGHISPLYYPMIQLANAHKPLVDMFKDEFGGFRSERLSYFGKDKSVRRPSHQWKMEKSTSCLPFLEEIIPYLVVKKERATYLRDYILDNPFKRGGGRLDDNILRNRESAYIKMKSLNEYADIHGNILSKNKRIDSSDEQFWAYVAGIMDTDGSFSVKKENRAADGCINPKYSVLILLTMNDCRAIYHIYNNFDGGNIITVKAKTSNQGFCYRYMLNNREKVIKFLKNCIPYLFIKKDIAINLLGFCESFKSSAGPKGLSSEELSSRESYYLKAKELHGVYKSPVIDLELHRKDADNKGQAGNVQAERLTPETSQEDVIV